MSWLESSRIAEWIRSCDGLVSRPCSTLPRGDERFRCHQCERLLAFANKRRKGSNLIVIARRGTSDRPI